jgi:quinol monooxygenase YgiN
MSVIIIAKVHGDTDKFRGALTERGAEFAQIGERARAGSGALHHRFGIGEGYVLIVDEWESAEQFQQFFGDPSLQEFVTAVGGDTSVPPEITVCEAIESPDQF